MFFLRTSICTLLLLLICLSGTFLLSAQTSVNPSSSNIATLRRKANAGDAAAAYKLGGLYEDGIWVTQSYPEAKLWYKMAANRGFARAQYELGFIYENGFGGTKDLSQALILFQKAAGQNLVEAQFMLGYMYRTGEGTPRNFSQARLWYRRAAAHGYAPAKDALTQLETLQSYLKEQQAIQQQAGKQPADNGNSELATIRRKANAGDPISQNGLGHIYQFGTYAAQNYAEAVKWYRKAAYQKLAFAQNNLGNMYYSGHGVPQNYAQALTWYRKAANQNLSDAQYSLGAMYYAGRGVPQDYAQALIWYQKAAEQGYAIAQNDIGTMYYDGHGVQQDYAQALTWYRKAAELNFAIAERNLGFMYQNGNGVPQDYTQAGAWYQKAANQGYQIAKTALAQLDALESQQNLARQQAAQQQAAHQAETQQQVALQPQPSGPPAATQSKIDIDQTDVAAFQNELTAAHDKKLHIDVPKDERNTLKACNKDYSSIFWDTRKSCESLGNSDLSMPTDEREEALLRGCSFPDTKISGAVINPCLDLGRLYEGDHQYIQALLVYSSSSCATSFSASAGCLEGMRHAYQALGNTPAVNRALNSLCFQLYQQNACTELQATGVQVDMDSIASQGQKAHDEESQQYEAIQNSDTARLDHTPAWLSILTAVGNATQQAGTSSTAAYTQPANVTNTDANGTDGSASGGSYSGPDSGEVGTLLSRSPSAWSCPTSRTEQPTGQPIKPSSVPCVRDDYVWAAILEAYGAECHSRLGMQSEAEQNAQAMMKYLNAAKAMCSGSPAVGPQTCTTLSIYSCNE